MIAGRILPVCIIFVWVPVLSSCDFLRKMAGRPTSSELMQLARKRDSIETVLRLEEERLAQQAAADTLALEQPVEEPVTDESRIQALIDGCGPVLHYPFSRFRGCAQAGELFYVIAGTFKEPANAERYTARLQSGAFPQARVLTLGNGYRLASVFSSDNAGQTLLFLSEHKTELPSEAWILINDLR